MVERNPRRTIVYKAVEAPPEESEADEPREPMKVRESPVRNGRAEESRRTGKDHREMWRRKRVEPDAGNREGLLSWGRLRDSSFLPERQNLPERQKRNPLSSWHLREEKTTPPA